MDSLVLRAISRRAGRPPQARLTTYQPVGMSAQEEDAFADAGQPKAARRATWIIRRVVSPRRGLRRPRGFPPRGEGSSPRRATRSRGSGANCHGRGSRRAMLFEIVLRREIAGGSVRRPQSARSSSISCSRRIGKRAASGLVQFGSCGWSAAPCSSARCDLRRRVAGAAGKARCDTRSAWAGRLNGFRRARMSSITIFVCRFVRATSRLKRAVYNYAPLTFEASDLSGVSVFLKDPSGGIFHTYSTFARGDEMLMTAVHVHRLAAEGQETRSTRRIRPVGGAATIDYVSRSPLLQRSRMPACQLEHGVGSMRDPNAIASRAPPDARRPGRATGSSTPRSM